MITEGWEEGNRVPVTQPVYPGEEPDTPEADRHDGPTRLERPTLWPTVERPELASWYYLPIEVDAISRHARRDLMGWIAGAGLHPVSVLHRVTMLFGLPGVVTNPPGWVTPQMQADIRRGLEVAKWMGPKLYPGNKRDVAKGMARADGVIRGISMREGRRIAPVRWSLGECPLREPWHGETIRRWEEPWEIEKMEIRRYAMLTLARQLVRGPTPFLLVQQWFALCLAFWKDILGPMSGEDVGQLLGQTRAAVHEAVKVFRIEGERVTGEVIKVSGQKPASASVLYAENARRHAPRRQLNGQAATPKRERETQVRVQEYADTMTAARRIEDGEARQAEKDAAEFAEMMRAARAKREARRG